MIGRISIEEAGFSREGVARFLAALDKQGCNMHAVLLLRGNDIFFEKYWAPFHAERPHRMYSVTKSFVAVAIGLLADEGKLSLEDPIIRYFPDKLPETIHPLWARQTIRDMLMMSTCVVCGNWFQPQVQDRMAFYFAHAPVKIPGTVFDYDSNGSYILGVLVERLAGMPLLAYLKRKVLDKLGGFENAEMLQVPDGSSWGDSALVCTPRALMNFARFVMNHGVWEGERLLSEDYLRQATTCRTDNDLEGRTAWNRHGYGYQFWMTEQQGFACVGMGGQLAVCLPEKELIFVCNADTQINPAENREIMRAFFDLVEGVGGDVPPPLSLLEAPKALRVARGMVASPFAAQIDGVTFTCLQNPMGITSVCFHFGMEESCICYQNGQGKQEIRFGLGKNVFQKFPQAGYSNERGNVHELTDFRYDCAASAGWVEPQKLQIDVQIIDRYVGSLCMTFGFKDAGCFSAYMWRAAEDFLTEYEGWLTGVAR